jgi:hypothetical protein
VATQLARSAEPGDREAISALRQAAQSVGHSDASAAADLSKRALQLLPADDPEHGSLVAETVGLLNRASRYEEAEELAVAALSEAASPQEEAEIRLRLPTFNKHSAQRRVEESSSAAVGRHQRGHPGTTSGVPGLQPGDARPTWVTARGGQRGCRGRCIDR